MWVVDTCIVIDVVDDDPEFGRASATCLAELLEEGLELSPVSYVELAPVFDGSRRLLDEFLARAGITCSAGLDAEERAIAFSAWRRYVQERRRKGIARRPVADALIGACAVRHGGLITRNGADFLSFYPDLVVRSPVAQA